MFFQSQLLNLFGTAMENYHSCGRKMYTWNMPSGSILFLLDIRLGEKLVFRSGLVWKRPKPCPSLKKLEFKARRKLFGLDSCWGFFVLVRPRIQRKPGSARATCESHFLNSPYDYGYYLFYIFNDATWWF